eukprot:2576044-Prymnesium_polylepis.1
MSSHSCTHAHKKAAKLNQILAPTNSINSELSQERDEQLRPKAQHRTRLAKVSAVGGQRSPIQRPPQLFPRVGTRPTEHEPVLVGSERSDLEDGQHRRPRLGAEARRHRRLPLVKLQTPFAVCERDAPQREGLVVFAVVLVHITPVGRVCKMLRRRLAPDEPRRARRRALRRPPARHVAQLPSENFGSAAVVVQPDVE